MAWLPDEQYVLMQDTREKAITARSARHTRTHNGKGGAVKFPSDYLTAKERKKLNGECITYASLKKPMTWKEFKKLPDDLKKEYIKSLRAKFNVPDNHIAAMMGIDHCVFGKVSKELGLSRGRNYVGRKNWDKEGFAAWCGKTVEKPEEPIDIPVEENKETAVKDVIIDNPREVSQIVKEAVEHIDNSIDNRGAVPTNGTLTFEGKSEDILRTLNDIFRGRYVKLSVQWSVEEAPAENYTINMSEDALKNAAKTINYAVLNNQRRRVLGSKG